MSTFVLMGMLGSSGGDDGSSDGSSNTRSSSIGGGGFALPDATPTASAAPASNASVDVAQVTPGELKTLVPRATEEALTTAPAAEVIPAKPKQGLPGFTVVFAICMGCLAVAYATMRRRE